MLGPAMVVVLERHSTLPRLEVVTVVIGSLVVVSKLMRVDAVGSDHGQLVPVNRSSRVWDNGGGSDGLKGHLVPVARV
jgi:hypothetical protein